jgi:3-methyladenine DNA glycosylase AlkD
MTLLLALREELQKLKSPTKAKVFQGFFKTGEGQYGYGDIFLGITVPQSRKLAIQFKELPFDQIKKLLISKIHEERLIALLILVHNFEKGSEEKRKEIFDFYLSHTQYINNWDLVDVSADKIVGGFGGSSVLSLLAHSASIWERRIAIIATFQLIKEKKEYEETFKVAEILLQDKHDLIHKAVGWMLREVGKRCSQEAEEMFLKKHYQTMPRTMLRYAIERFPIELREKYLNGKI